MRAKVESAGRRVKLGWRRLRAAVREQRVTRSGLSDALGVAEHALGPRIMTIRRQLAGRVAGGPHDVEAIRHALDAHAAGERARIVEQAEIVRRHVFDLLGSGPVDLGDAIDWHTDFKSGFRWSPEQHYSTVRIGRSGADVKLPWELSRGHHLPLLAQASRLTERHEFAREAVDQILHWIDANPPEKGVNWVCAMDVAIRCVNWLWTAAWLAPVESVDDRFYERLFASLLDHGRFIEANLEIMPGGLRTNHYIADLVGLLYVGLCIPEFAESRRWATFAHVELSAEMQRQVLPDGVSFESSIPYHRLVAEMFLSSALLGRWNGVPFDEHFHERLAKMVTFTAAYTKPNGLAPQIGDADDGRLHILSGYGTADPRDHRHLLAAGAVFFDRGDWYQAAGERWVEALWFGDTARRRDVGPGAHPQSSASFPNAGIIILRRHDDFVIVTAGPVGTGGLGNHKHNDLLSFEAHLLGEDVLIDPGTFAYTGDPVARNAFRSTRAHNTVMIDGVEQNRIPAASLFSLQDDAHPRWLSWMPSGEGGSVTLEHDGYGRLASPVIHRRTVTLTVNHRIIVEDVFTEPLGTHATSPHTLLWTFQFAVGCRVVRTGDGWTVATQQGRHFRVSITSDETLASGVDSGWVSPRFGVREPAMTLWSSWCGTVPFATRFEMSCDD